jgi:hypothetical protein
VLVELRKPRCQAFLNRPGFRRGSFVWFSQAASG